MSDSPYYRFYRRISYRIPFKQWLKLPRIPGYKNEYWDGKARLTPRPHTCDMLLDLAKWSAPSEPAEVLHGGEEVTVRPLREQDWAELPRAFLSAFGNQPPLSSWGEHAARRAARCIMEWTRQGRDGRLIPAGCFAAWTRDRFGGEKHKGNDEWVCGAAIVTLIPARCVLGAEDADGVPDPEHPDDAGRRVLPHLDWVFVNHWLHRRGIATMLLEAVVTSLQTAGYPRLASTSLLSNSASLLWHWRNGFTLAPNPWARRARRKQ